jgi:hypothetical protein
VKALSGDARETPAIARAAPVPTPAPASASVPATTSVAAPPPVPKAAIARPPAVAAGQAAPASTPVATRSPPHIAPTPEQSARLAQRVDAMFGTDKDQRIAATTGLIVEPEALSDAAPLALAKALATLRRGPVLDTAASSGIVNTLVLLQAALPGTLLTQRTQVESLLAATQSMGDTTRAQAARLASVLQRADGKKPVVYLQIANEAQRPIAEALATRFRSFGYEAPGIELVGNRAPAATELRVQGKSDRGFARWLVRVVGELAGAESGVQTLRNAKPAVDAYEVWLGRTLCVGEEVEPGCRGTGR